MRKLMISLDKKILEESSSVGRRMIDYGKKDELFILIPAREKKNLDLSDHVHVYTTGGNKIQQYVRLKYMGLNMMQKNDIGFVTVQDPSFSGNVGRWLKKKTKATLEIQLHGDFYGSEYYKRRFKDLIGYFLFGRRNIRSADTVRVVSERVKKTVLDLGVEKKKIVVIPVQTFENNRQITTLPMNVKEQFPGHEKYFLFAGRLEDVKNVGWLIEIFETIVRTKYRKNFFLLIVGEGSQKKDLLSLVEKKDLGKYVRFKGWTDSLRDCYTSVDAVLFPSQSEGYGLVPMEAVALGARVIMTDVGVANYELKATDRVTIVPVNDTEAFIRAVLSI